MLCSWPLSSILESSFEGRETNEISRSGLLVESESDPEALASASLEELRSASASVSIAFFSRSESSSNRLRLCRLASRNQRSLRN